MMTTRDIQVTLAGLGFDPGPIDGVRGRKTILATIALQKRERLVADGIVGAETAAALAPLSKPKLGRAPPPAKLPAVAPGPSAPWFIEAQRLIGVTEDTSPASNPLLIGWGKDLRCHYTDDETPWCGLFVGHCIASQLLAEPLPINPLGARQWSTFGRRCEPQPGAVMIFWRVSKSDGRGHVGFYVAEDAGFYHILGGNQSDAVNVVRVPRKRFLQARWPTTAPPPAGHVVIADATGAITSGEA